MPQPPKNSPTPKPKSLVDWVGEHGASTGGNGDDDRVVWKATQIGDTLTGVLQRVARVNTKYGERTVVEFGNCRELISDGEAMESGGECEHWPTQGLINAFADAGAAIGGSYKVDLVDLIDTNRGNPFKSFVVELADESF